MIQSFRCKGSPINNFCTVSARLVRPINALGPTTLPLTVFTQKKLCSRLSLSEVRFYTEIGRFAFFWDPFGGLRGNVRCSSWVHWKARSWLPIIVNGIFFARCYGWGATGEYLLKIGEFAPTGTGWPKVWRRRGHRFACTNYSSSQKTKLNDLSYGIKIWTDLSTVLSQFTRVTDRQIDGRTDTQTEFSSLDRVCIPCSAVKTTL